MDQKVQRILEYHKICALLAQYTVSEIGRNAASLLQPAGTYAEVQVLLNQTSEAMDIYRRGGHNPVETFTDMREHLKRMHAAIAFSAGELLELARCMYVSRVARERLTAEETTGLLAHMASQLCSHKFVEDEIRKCILSPEEIADAASPALMRIRRQMRLTNDRVRARLNDMIHSTTFQQYLQDPIVTIRNGRFVLPVKQEYRQYVPGLVHDQSGSGATVFIEPTSVVELGNEYKRLAAEEQTEIERILAELTALVAPYADELYASLEILGTLDLIFAKASFARDLKANCPELNHDGHIRILRARHPLIDKESVVPVDLWLGEQARMLIITGPNTGGKTVTLKTVGLFVLMAQAGMFIPAQEGSKLCVFSQVYADIGDEQSIEQSLSTFSSHMTNIVGILEKAGPDTLVLLDELGAGTDPVEGAALAMSILETLYARGCMTMATTHYSEIKAFAMTHEGMENASMEFDVDRLCPTYRLLIGTPGKSNAFEISKRLGLNESVIERAREFLKSEDVQFEDVMQSAQAQRRNAELEKQKAQEERWELERLRGEVRAAKEKLVAERARLKDKAQEEARQVVSDARKEMDEVIAGLKNLKNVDQRQLDRAIQQARDRARGMEKKFYQPQQRTEEGGTVPKKIQPGDRVRIASLGQNATVLKVQESKNEVQVQAGVMKLTVNRSDLRTIEREIEPPRTNMKKPLLAERDVGLSLDVRGKLVDEAIMEVERYIDNAVLVGRSELTIVHGKGTGALRAGIQQYLRKNPRVKSFRLGNYGEGDAGVTVVTLK